jgi:hypothetical protein
LACERQAGPKGTRGSRDTQAAALRPMGIEATRPQVSQGKPPMIAHDPATVHPHHRRVSGTAAASEGHLSGPRFDSSDAAPLFFSISVVIPTRNEAHNIGWVLERIGPIVDEIVIVDGLSEDGTVEAAIQVRPDSVIVNHPVAGKGEAVRAGFASATGDLIVILDADGSMDPAEIPDFVEELARGSDLVKGSRFLPGGGTTDMTLVRRFGNAVLVRLANLLLRTSHTELCYGYMAFRRSRLDELDLRATGFEIETELVVKACRAGLAVTEIPSFESPRRYGTSNLNTFRDGWRVLRTLLRESLSAPTEPASSSESLYVASTMPPE